MKLSGAIILGCLAQAVVSQVIELNYKSIATGETGTFGVLQYDKDTQQTDFQITEGLVNGEYCIGTSSVADHECFSYLKVRPETDLSRKNIQLYLDEENHIRQLAVVESSQVSIKHIAKSSQPNFEAAKNDAATGGANKAAVRKEVVLKKVSIIEVDEDGNEVEREIEEEVEVEIDDRSWIQKNWMFVVAGLAFFLMMQSDEKKE